MIWRNVSICNTNVSKKKIKFQVSEMFPTSVRSTALGVCSLFSRVGGILAPLITNSNIAGYSLIIFGFFGTFAGFAAFFLPETKGKNLPESIAEAESADDSYQFSDFSKLCFKRNSTL